jgi:Tol biopolymer transport system component
MEELPSRLGPYEIVSPLGAGGMGQVYRARDTRLQRFVAIKILHDHAALDRDRQRRFAQEAVAASALNHPNILTVYDVGADGDTQYLVSELIEGHSLRAEMDRGRLPLKRVVQIAHQIAEGLSAAHEAGIVHRDLKPENVMVTADGRLKIVDFGLAKAADGEAALAAGYSATQTAAGLILGTVPYMSPEQARGSAADFRSDQFALGVILYEMTTATHPFKRETAVQTLSAIIAEEPPDPAQIAPTVPVAVRWLMRRLLAKNPRERFAHTADLAADLRTIRDYLSEATTAVAPVAARRRNWQLPAAGAGLVAAGLMLGLTLGPSDRGVGFEKFTPFATDAGYQGAPAWSPDGKQIAYEAEINGVVQLFVRAPGATTRTQLTHSAFDCYVSEWSTDGYIYYHSRARAGDALWRVTPVGGNPELIIEGASKSAIAPDGKSLFFLRDDSNAGLAQTLWFATLPDLKEQRFTRDELKGIGSSGYLRFSPDGARLMLFLGPDPNSDASFWDLPLPNGKPRRLLTELSTLGSAPPVFSWLPDSRHIVVTSSNGPSPGAHLWVADTAPPSRLALAIPAWGTTVLRPITPTPGNEGAPAASPDGRTVAFTWEATDFDLFEVPLDGSPLKPFLSTTRNEYDPAASPANTQYAFVSDQSGKQHIWLYNEEGYLHQRLVGEADFGEVASGAVGSLAFSHDGTRLAFQRASAKAAGGRGRGSRIWVTSTTGGTPVPIGDDATTYEDAPTWSPKGDWIAYLRGVRSDLSLVKVQVGGRTDPVPLIGSIPPFVTRPQWSPDGNWILCETADGLIVIRPDGTGQRVIGDTGWFAFAWDKNSEKVYGLRPTEDDHHFMLVSVDSRTAVQRVINPNLGPIPQALQPIRGFSRFHDKGFLTSVARVKSDIYLIENFRLPLKWWERLWRLGRDSD